MDFPPCLISHARAMKPFSYGLYGTPNPVDITADDKVRLFTNAHFSANGFRDCAATPMDILPIGEKL
jgi:hypothetical protein